MNRTAKELTQLIEGTIAEIIKATQDWDKEHRPKKLRKGDKHFWGKAVFIKCLDFCSKICRKNKMDEDRILEIAGWNKDYADTIN